MSGMEPDVKKNRVALPWRLLHWAIVVNFLVEIAYAGYQVFVVFAPPGGGPLGAGARDFPPELMLPRRLYALEAWIAFCGLSIYLGVTELGPRFWRKSGA